jgi:hypothetical protein
MTLTGAVSAPLIRGRRRCDHLPQYAGKVGTEWRAGWAFPPRQMGRSLEPAKGRGDAEYVIRRTQ